MKKIGTRILACALLLSLFVFPAQAAGTSFKASTTPDHITLTWSGDPETTQTITWRTDTSVSSSYVQYTAGSDSSFSAGVTQESGTVTPYQTDLGTENIHAVTLEGLSAGTKYTYRVGDGANWSSAHTFTTEAADTQSFKFLVFGDSQSGQATTYEYGPWKTTVHNAFAANPDAKFLMNVGDLVEIGNMQAHWENWYDAAAGVIDTIPEMPVQGNHETYQDPTYSSMKPNLYVNQFNVPQNGPDGLKGQTYSFNYGSVHFVVLDSQEAEEQPVGGDIFAPQEAWLEQDLSANTQDWTVVLMHKTIYYNKATRTNEDLKAAFQPIFDKYHVDVVFDGHDHDYSRTYPMYGDHMVSSPAQGTVYVCTGRSGNKYYTDLSAKVWDAFYYDPQDQPNYLTAEVDGSKLTIRAVKQDGTLIDSYTINKSTGTDTPQTIVPGKANYTRLAVYGNELHTPLLTSAPEQINGKWYVPVRSFAEFLGGTVMWNGSDNSVSLAVGSTAAQIQLNTTSAKLNGSAVTLPDAVTVNAKFSTLISADDLHQLLGFTYQYDASTNMLLFTK